LSGTRIVASCSEFVRVRNVLLRVVRKYASLPRTMAKVVVVRVSRVEGSSAFHVVEDEVVWDCCAFHRC
jgi:hypothetical protein